MLHLGLPRLSTRALRRRLSRHLARLTRRHSPVPASLLALALAFGLGAPARAATDAWSGTAGDGLWGSAANWNGGAGPVPASGDSAQNLLTTSNITLNVNATVNSFLDDSAFTVSGGNTLSGSQAGQGSTVTVNDPFTINGGGLSNLTVSGGQGPTFLGTGDAISNVTFNSGADFGAASVSVYGTDTLASAGTIEGGTLQLNPDNNGGTLALTGAGSLSGYGAITQNYGGSVTNAGTINANTSGKTLSFAVNSLSGNGSYDAGNGGTLALNTLSTSGTIGASTGGAVNLTGALNAGSGTTINVDSSAGSVVQLEGGTATGTISTTTGTGLTLNGAFNSTLSNLTTGAGTTLTFTAGAGQQQLDGTETVSGALTLSGASLRLNPGNNGGTLALTSTGSLTGSGSVIQNYGGAVANSGTINANNSAGPLSFTLNAFNNNAGATAEATGGATLNINNAAVTDAGTFQDVGASTVSFSADTLTAQAGSQFNAGPSGRLLVTGGTTVTGEVAKTTGTGLTFDGTVNNTLSNLTTDAGTTLTFAAATGSAQQQLDGTETVSGALTLSGASLRLNPGNNGGTLALTSTGSLTGSGSVNQNYGGAVTDGGAVTASGGTLSFTEDTFNNNGTASAVAGAGLTLGGANVYANGTGTISANGGSVTIQNGTLTAQAGSQFLSSSGGGITVNNETVTGEIGKLTALTLTNNNLLTNLTVDSGTFNFGSSADDLNGSITLKGAATLSGASLRLNPGNNGGTLALTSTGSLTGYGLVNQNYGGAVINDGAITASTKPLTFNVAAFSNDAGATAATAGADTLTVENAAVSNAGTFSNAGAGSVVFSADALTAVKAGAFNAGAGTIQVTGGTTLTGEVGTTSGTGLTVDGTTGNALRSLTTDAGTVLTFTTATGTTQQGVYGTNTINGALNLTNAALQLNPDNNGGALNITATGSLTGSGAITQNYGGSVTNAGAITAGGALSFAVNTFTNNKTVGVTTGGSLVLNGGQVTNNGTIQSGGSGVTVENGTLTGGGSASVLDATGGSLTATNETLNGEIGAIKGAGLTLSSSVGNNALRGLTVDGGALNFGASTANVYGTNTFNGSATLAGGDLYLNPDNNGADLVVNGTLSGAGTVNQDYGAAVDDNGTINAVGSAAAGPLTIAVNNFNVNAGAVAEATGAGGLLLNGGTVTDSATGTVRANGGGVTIENGTLASVAGSTYDATGGSLTVTNETLTGEIGKATGGGLTLSSSAGNNALRGLTFDGGTLAFGASTANVYGTNTFNGSATLAGGTLELNPDNNGGTLAITGTGSLTGAGTVNQNYGGAVTNAGTVDASGGTLNVNTSTLTNTGTLQAEKGATLAVSASTTDSGSILVKSGGTETFTQAQGLTQTAGLTQVDGALNANGFALQGGQLDGAGTVNSAVTNTGGAVKGGDSPGTLTIAGDYTQALGGSLLDQIGGFSLGQSDILSVTGAASLAGALDVSLLPGFAPTSASIGRQIVFLDYGTLLADTLTVNSQNAGYSYTIGNDTTNKDLYLVISNAPPPAPAVPEPSSPALLALPLAGLALAARRRRSAPPAVVRPLHERSDRHALTDGA